MTKAGLRVTDIGEGFTWNDFRDFVTNLPPSGESALYRVQHPQSWWWTAELDFMGAVLTAIQWGNWQRAGGKGDKPRQPQRPLDKPAASAGAVPRTAEDLAARKKAMKQKMMEVERGN